MKKVFIYIILIFNLTSLFAEETFDEKQETFQKIKEIILYEESFSRAYQEYLVSNYAFPTLENIQGMGAKIDDEKNTIHKPTTFTPSFTKLSYGLSEDAKKIQGAIEFYESNNFRNNTYIQSKGSTKSVYFMLEDEFANHIFYLLMKAGGIANPCEKNTTCIQSDKEKAYYNHIFVNVPDTDDALTNGVPSDYLMAYHVDKFKTGPIIANNPKALDKDFKNLIPKGAILYDYDGKKYIKVQDEVDEIVELK